MATLVLKLKDREIATLPIQKTVTQIGRDVESDLVIDNDAISRRHASVRWEEGRWRLKDEGSANGIFLHGERIATSDLEEGDSFLLGKFMVVFTERGGASPGDLLPAAGAGARSPIGTLFLDDKDMVRILRAAGEKRDESPLPRPRTEPDLDAAPAGGRVQGGTSLWQLVLVAVLASAATAGLLWAFAM